jgi:atypical dual specificity phosphatase
MRGFYWLIDGQLAGCPRPGGRDVGNPFERKNDAVLEQTNRLDDDLAWLEEQGIGAVLSLTETPLAAETLARHEKLAVLHVPVPDMTPPLPGQLVRALEFIDEQRAQERAVVVHCLMGQGRTGTVLAAYLIRGGASPAEALRTVRGVCVGAVESSSQERALYAFAERRDWIV